MDRVFFVSNIFLNIIHVLSDYMFMEAFLGKSKHDRNVVLFSYSLYYLAVTYAFLGINRPLIVTLVNLIGLLLLSLLYKGSLFKKILSVSIICILLFSTEIIVTVFLYGNNFSVLEANEFYSISAIIILKGVNFVIAIWIKNIFTKNNQIEIPTHYNFILLFTQVLSLFLMVIILFSLDTKNIYIVISLGVLLVINILIFFLYIGITNLVDVTLSQQLQLKQKELIESQISYMEDSLKEVRRIEHDMKNKLTPIYGMACQDENENIAVYVSEFLGNFPTTKFEAKSGLVELDSILNYKLMRAKELGIKTKLKLLIPGELKIKPMDLAVVMGNLIDNAIEGTLKAEDKWIDIRLKYIKGIVKIDVRNSYDGVVLKKKDKIVTRKDNLLIHGMGIDSVREILTRYDGDLDIYYDDKEFHVVGSFFG